MPDIQIEIVGRGELAAKLARVATQVTTMRPALEDVGDYLRGFFAGEVFASRGGVFGHQWASLNSTYAAQKAKRYPGAPPLVQTGLMQRSFKNTASNDTAVISNTAKHFPYHQLGTGSIPARIMMDVDRPRLASIMNIIDNHLMRAVRRLQ